MQHSVAGGDAIGRQNFRRSLLGGRPHGQGDGQHLAIPQGDQAADGTREAQFTVAPTHEPFAFEAEHPLRREGLE